MNGLNINRLRELDNESVGDRWFNLFGSRPVLQGVSLFNCPDTIMDEFWKEIEHLRKRRKP